MNLRTLIHQCSGHVVIALVLLGGLVGCHQSQPTLTASPTQTLTPVAPTQTLIPIDPTTLYSNYTSVLPLGVLSTRTPVQNPRFINHTPPRLNLDVSSLDAAGCGQSVDGYFCPQTSQISQFDCKYLTIGDSLWGGLEPNYPIVAKCERDETDHEGLFYSGCLIHLSVSFVMYANQRFQLITSQEQIRAIYSPIQSEDEALSYTLITTGLSADYSLKLEPNIYYLTSIIEDTYVRSTKHGFIVHLYNHQICSCNPHTTTAVDILVQSDGIVKWLGGRPTYDDGTEGLGCVD